MARSKKEVEAMVSAMGVFASLITDLVGFVKELGGTVENIYRLATPEGAETLKKVAEVIVREANNCLRLISGSELVINPTSGRVIADANDVFGYIGYNFREKADEAGKPTEETPVHIYEMTQDATLAQIFSDPDKMTLTQGQIIEFVEKYPEWFRQNDYAATLFLFRSYGKFFTADVRKSSGGRLCSILVSRLDLDLGGVWCAEHRHHVVLP